MREKSDKYIEMMMSMYCEDLRCTCGTCPVHPPKPKETFTAEDKDWAKEMGIAL